MSFSEEPSSKAKVIAFQFQEIQSQWILKSEKYTGPIGLVNIEMQKISFHTSHQNIQTKK